MSKTDKELAVEITNNFVSSWLSADKGRNITIDNVNSILKTVHTTLQNLSEDKQ